MATTRKKSSGSASRSQKCTTSLPIINGNTAKFGTKTTTNFYKASRRKFGQRNRFRHFTQFIRQLQRTRNRLVFDTQFFFSFTKLYRWLTLPNNSKIEIEWKKHGCHGSNSNEKKKKKRTYEFSGFYFCAVHAAAVPHNRVHVRSFVCIVYIFICR